MRNNKPGCLGIFFPFLRTKETPTLPYFIVKNFLSPAELSFYKILSSMTGTKLTIQTKVGLKDIFRTNSKSHFNKINQKHVDFLICETETMKPIIGIELDDTSHNQKTRQERDKFVDDVFKTASLPLIHITAQREYNTEIIKTKIATALNNSK